MSSYTDRIRPSDVGLTTYLENLRNKEYQIPTFQRDVVWENEGIKKLWDSIYKFYPFGSILIWNTDVKLHKHKEIGGHVIEDSFERSQYKYILDGQQRTTSLLLSLYGGEIKGRDGFNPIVYIDLTVEHVQDTDDESYRNRFLFWDEINDKGGVYKANSGKMKRYRDGLIVKLIDIKQHKDSIDEALEERGFKFKDTVRIQLRRFKEILDNYRVPLIELKGITVSEVCQIFERINKSGKPLDIFDIVVAKTYRPEDRAKGITSFYLRELFDEFKKGRSGNYISEIDHISLLQMIAVSVKRIFPEANILNITDTYLNQIKTEHIEGTWDKTKAAILKTFDFFDNHMNIKGPSLVPFRYFYLSLVPYFLEVKDVDYDFLQKYFWFYSFHNDDLLGNTTHLHQHVAFLLGEDKSEKRFGRFYIDKQKLRSASYSSKGRLSRALLSLFSSHSPRDWGNPSRFVINDVYYTITDKPNLHHIFPSDFIQKNPGRNSLDVNSLMNIVYLTQITNLEISNKNPLQYLQDYISPIFESTLRDHLVPVEVLEWCNDVSPPENALDIFIEKRVELVIEDLKCKLPDIVFDVIDTA